ncbi:TerB family tellurite resistance protein [Bacillus thuringiensis]|uniref:TerB family tellurite resistance protein n=2 Tax=Bacillus cereus group TaxID=86661 RepID=A0A9X6UBA7_BACCE|nr:MULTISPECIES: TerB family tellurite resistance protein [Bacillus cereus group]ALC50538.1 Tellurite resistance protein TerB [Bacillus cereus]MBG9716006.1 Tellurite resistance protein TerB [Bacillus cereus]MED3052270.1 TerB family tellurite resistance protein [Bacillus thuringiensis]PEA14289.1 TerB family tellurite resistance protein [Bacillus thuringiensis]PEN96167.1 TerB family tellurite resistance protein [Bacillus cereus]
MGLFDMFKGDKTRTENGMEPHFAFATSLLYMMGADGEYDNEELGQLLSVLGGKNKGGTIYVGGNNDDLLEKAIKYVRKNSLDTFLKEAAPSLTDAQKMCILVNLIDSSLSDGEAEREEQMMFGKFLQAFDISEERFKPFFEVIVLKNDRSVFTNQNHPKNQLRKIELAKA